MNSTERSKKIGSLQLNFSPVCKELDLITLITLICISSLQLHVQGFSPVCQVSSILDYYAVKNLHHIDYIDKDNSYNNFT